MERSDIRTNVPTTGVALADTEARRSRVVLPEWSPYSDRDRRWIDRSWLLGPKYMHDIDWDSVVGDAANMASLTWIDRGENVVVFGDSTSIAEDLAKAVTCEALRRRRTARCYPASSFAAWLREGEQQGRLRQRLRRWAEFDLVVLTDAPSGDDAGAPLIRGLLRMRREHGATLLTIRRHGPAWNRVWSALGQTDDVAEYFTTTDLVTRVACPSRNVVLGFDGARADDDPWESDDVVDAIDG